MVQVDVFWSYGLGAGLAAAASDNLQDEAAAGNDDPLASRHFAWALLYVAVLFAPSGACLLWAFPSWETMHAGDENLPAWLVTTFAATNVTQGVVGYLVARRLILAGKRYAAFLHCLGAYLCMFFILVHGWDGTGYQRFFSATPEEFARWSPANVSAFLVSDVALTLYGMGVVLIPVLLGLMATWIRQGYRRRHGPDSRPPSVAGLCARFLFAVFGFGLGGAIVASLMVRALGWIPGLPAFLALAYLVGVRAVVPRLFAGLLPDGPAPEPADSTGPLRGAG